MYKVKCNKNHIDRVNKQERDYETLDNILDTKRCYRVSHISRQKLTFNTHKIIYDYMTAPTSNRRPYIKLNNLNQSI